MNEETLDALRLTLQVATVATVLVLVPGTLLAYVLARYEFPFKGVLSTLLTLPLVLPPTAVGFMLLQLFAMDGPLGPATIGFDFDVILTWKGAVLASAVMALPLVVRTARVTFEGIDPRLEAIDRTLGHRPVMVFVRTTLPLAYRGLLAAAILGFTPRGRIRRHRHHRRQYPRQDPNPVVGDLLRQQAGRDQRATFLLLIALAVGFAAIYASERLAGIEHWWRGEYRGRNRRRTRTRALPPPDRGPLDVTCTTRARRPPPSSAHRAPGKTSLL